MTNQAVTIGVPGGIRVGLWGLTGVTGCGLKLARKPAYLTLHPRRPSTA
jgi:hypothetical protein